MPRRCIVAIDPTGKKLACLAEDGLTVLDIDTRAVLFEEKWKAIHSVPSGAVAFSREGTRVAYVSAKELAIVDLQTKKVVARTPMATWTIGSVVAISDDGERAATARMMERGDELHPELLVLRTNSDVEWIRLPSGARYASEPKQLAIDGWGNILARWMHGGVVLVDPQRHVSKITRSAADEGIWLVTNGRVRAIGNVSASSHGIACRVGSSIVPSAACLPLLCDRPVMR